MVFPDKKWFNKNHQLNFHSTKVGLPFPGGNVRWTCKHYTMIPTAKWKGSLIGVINRLAHNTAQLFEECQAVWQAINRSVKKNMAQFLNSLLYFTVESLYNVSNVLWVAFYQHKFYKKEPTSYFFRPQTVTYTKTVFIFYFFTCTAYHQEQE